MDESNLDNQVTSAHLANAQIEPISIEKMEEILKQYSESHLKYLEAQKILMAQKYITMNRTGLIDRGQLAKELDAIGFDGLEIVEILELEGL